MAQDDAIWAFRLPIHGNEWRRCNVLKPDADALLRRCSLSITHDDGAHAEHELHELPTARYVRTGPATYNQHHLLK